MPEIPNWGVVHAAPHERLLQIRTGKVIRNQQGGSCFKWPGDTVARVDTSVRRLQFRADQVTRERVGVAVTGLAVFRVVQPLLAYRMLDLEDPDGFHEILREMFVGATRRLVANLTLDECLTRRKDALATELMAEVAPVVQGSGREGDDTAQGWGVALDTIEVQDVRVLSEEVFQRLQAPYREALALSALSAHAEVEREEARLAAERAQARESARRELMAKEEERLLAERARQRADVEHRAGLAWMEEAARLRREEAENQARAARVEHRAAVRRALAEASAESRVHIAEQDAAAERVLGQARAENTRLEREAASGITPDRLQEILLTETLPRMAEAFRGSVDQAVVVGGGDLSFLSQGVAQVMATLRAFGVVLPRSDA